jgi:hypothetical protein
MPSPPTYGPRHNNIDSGKKQDTAYGTHLLARVENKIGTLPRHTFLLLAFD